MTRKTTTAERAAEPATRVAPEVVKIGNLTRDPELGFGADNGTPYARTGLAVERPVTPGDWKGQRTTDFYEVTCFGSVAENAADSLSKGDRVIVVGRGEIEAWTDDDGNERKTKRILAEEVAPSLRWATVEIRKTNRRAKPTAVAKPADTEAF